MIIAVRIIVVNLTIAITYRLHNDAFRTNIAPRPNTPGLDFQSFSVASSSSSKNRRTARVPAWSGPVNLLCMDVQDGMERIGLMRCAVAVPGRSRQQRRPMAARREKGTFIYGYSMVSESGRFPSSNSCHPVHPCTFFLLDKVGVPVSNRKTLGRRRRFLST